VGCGLAGEACCAFTCDIGIRHEPDRVVLLNQSRSSSACSRLPAGNEACGSSFFPGFCSDGVCHDCGLEGQSCCSQEAIGDFCSSHTALACQNGVCLAM
jgi:hypothetical protein